MKGATMTARKWAATFNMLRANDLIWSFYVRNYLLGKDPFPFDLLYWNADSTRLPARMHSTYLRTMYLKNEFKEPGGIKRSRHPHRRQRDSNPCVLHFHGRGPYSALGGHLPGRANCCPGRSGSYLASQAILPASSTRRTQRSTVITPVPGLASPSAEWRANADTHPGSWWPDWQAWLEQLRRRQNPGAPPPAPTARPVIEDAPGSYVKLSF